MMEIRFGRILQILGIILLLIGVVSTYTIPAINDISPFTLTSICVGAFILIIGTIMERKKL